MVEALETEADHMDTEVIQKVVVVEGIKETVVGVTETSVEK